MNRKLIFKLVMLAVCVTVVTIAAIGTTPSNQNVVKSVFAVPDSISMQVAGSDSDSPYGCVSFHGDDTKPTIVTITNCGEVDLMLRSDKEWLPTLGVNEVQTYEIPVGYKLFESVIYRTDNTQLGSVNFS